MIEKYVAAVYFKEGFDLSNELDTEEEAISFIKGCSSNEEFEYGIIEKRYKAGEE